MYKDVPDRPRYHVLLPFTNALRSLHDFFFATFDRFDLSHTPAATPFGIYSVNKFHIPFLTGLLGSTVCISHLENLDNS